MTNTIELGPGTFPKLKLKSESHEKQIFCTRNVHWAAANGGVTKGGLRGDWPPFQDLVVRIARPELLVIWHRGRSHRRPNRSGSPNRRHFASLDLKNIPIFRIAGQHRRIFAGFFSCIFLRFQIKRMGFRIASEKNFFASLAIWGCAVRIASHIAVASRDLGH